MNYHMIRYVLGQIMKLEAALMGLPLLVSLYYIDEGMIPLLSVMLPLGISGYILTGFKPKNQTIYAREGFVIVAFAWILMSAIGALPFVISGTIPDFTDALFETVSGFTTTGSTLVPDVESFPMSLKMWRSFTHWIGGMGVLVFALAILPAGSAQSMYIMRAEVPGPSVGKLVAKTQITARILYGIYVFFTVLEAVMLRFTGMRWFDCIANAFATAGTGGFSVLNDGIGGYHNVWVEVIITAFMLIFSINFNLFYLLLIRRFSDVLRNVEIKVFFAIYIICTLLITCNIAPVYHSFSKDSTKTDALMSASTMVEHAPYIPICGTPRLLSPKVEAMHWLSRSPENITSTLAAGIAALSRAIFTASCCRVLSAFSHETCPSMGSSCTLSNLSPSGPSLSFFPATPAKASTVGFLSNLNVPLCSLCIFFSFVL